MKRNLKNAVMLLVLVLLAGNAYANTPPYQTNSLGITISFYEGNLTYDLSQRYTDAETPNDLTYSLQAINPIDGGPTDWIELSSDGILRQKAGTVLPTNSYSYILDYTVTDPGGLNTGFPIPSLLLGFSVSAVNSPPYVINPPLPSLTVQAGSSLNYDLSAHFADADGDPLSFSVTIMVPMADWLTCSPDGVLSGIPGSLGEYAIEFRVADGRGGDLYDSVLITVTSSITLPTVSTYNILNVTFDGATGGGNITSDGGASVTARGVCWSTSPNPTTGNSISPAGTGTGSFTSSLTGLTASTTYYVRAYATNSAGTAYGNQVSFTTLAYTRIIGLSGSLAFGNVTVNATKQLTFTISNTGNSPLTVSSISYPAGFAGNWSGTIAAGGSQPVTVTFAPAAVQSYTGTVTVSSDRTDGTNTIAVSGTGTPVPTRIIGLSGSLAFGSVNVNATKQLTFTISNTGNSPLTVSSISYPAGFAGNWSGTIAAGGSQPVTVTFAPTAVQSYTGTVTVSSDRTDGTNTIAVSGTGALSTFTISGYVKNASGTGISGVTLTFSSGGTADTNTSGFYSKTVSSGWTGTVTPSKSGYTFTPSNLAYTNVTANQADKNYTATAITLPTVSTSGILNITFDGAAGGGSITSDGGCAVTERGICWSEYPNPSLDCTKDGTGTGAFVSTLSDLKSVKTYYVRAYAKNCKGTAYGQDISFKPVKNPLENKINGLDGAANDQFGRSVSVSGDYAIVGAPVDSDKEYASGLAYIFKRDGSTWIQQAKLTVSDGAARDYFGYSVSISGDYAIIGATYDNDKGDHSGSAYIFKRDGSTWIQQAKLTASDGAVYDHFGNSVSISGDYTIVGAWNDTNKVYYNAGSAYIFKRDGNSWIQQAKLTASDGAVYDHFGSSVSISDDYAIIGAYEDNDKGLDSGSAYIFRRDGSTWIQQAKLTASDGAVRDYFGNSVSISGDYALIGAPSDDDKGDYSGSAYMFKREGTIWIQQAKLTASDGAVYDHFGYSVSISGDYALIGAYRNNYTGSAYIFRREGNTWIQQRKLTATDGAYQDVFGVSVSISNDYIVVGACYDDDKGTDSGSAYIYQLPSASATPVLLTSPNTTGTYNTGDTVNIYWQATGFSSTDTMTVAMKRASVPETQTEPDGVNWYRFTATTPNDGIETVTIPDTVAEADDWRFYVRHNTTGIWDPSDAIFSIREAVVELQSVGLDAGMNYPQAGILFYAKDSAGNPILTRTQSDFILTENGSPVPNFDFSAQSDGTYRISCQISNVTQDSVSLAVQHNQLQVSNTYVRNPAPEILISKTGILPKTVYAGQAVTIPVTAKDSDGIQSVILSFRAKNSGGQWKTATATAVNVPNYQFQIPGSDVTVSGIEYYALAEDKKGAKAAAGSAEIPHVLEVGTAPVPLDFETFFYTVVPDSFDLSVQFKIKGLKTGEQPRLSYLAGQSEALSGVWAIPVPSAGAVSYTCAENICNVLFHPEALRDKGFVQLQASASAGTASSKVIRYAPSSLDSYIRGKADTIILTNFQKMRERFSEQDISSLKNSISELVKQTWKMDLNGLPFAQDNSGFNMLPVVVDLGGEPVFDDTVIPSLRSFQIALTEDPSSLSTADSIVNSLTGMKNTEGFKTAGKMYLVIVGGHEIIPFGKAVNAFMEYKAEDGGVEKEVKWFNDNLKNKAPLLAPYYTEGVFPTDRTYRKSFKTGRLVETPSHITSQLDNFIQKKGYVLTATRAQYIGGYDKNSTTTGYRITQSLMEYFNTLPRAGQWMPEIRYYQPAGINGDTVVALFNSLSTGIIDLGGHGTYRSLQNSSVISEHFMADHDTVNGDGYVLEISHSLKDFIVFTNACHAGVNFSNADTDYEAGRRGDFAEAFVNDAGAISQNRALAVYISPSTYGKSSPKGLAYGDKVEYHAIYDLTTSSEKKVIYDAMFGQETIFLEYYTEGHPEMVEDLKSRPQFYGIPNYRRGPVPSQSRSAMTDDTESADFSSRSQTDEGFISKTIGFTETGVSAELTFSLSDFHFDSQTGKLNVFGIEGADMYDRPVSAWSLPVPDGATLTLFSVIDEQSSIDTYTDPIQMSICDSEGCVDTPLNTASFDDLSKTDARIEDGKLFVRFIPLQYLTATKQARISSMIKVRFEITFPAYIPDSDTDGLPDYWETAYGLNTDDPGSTNGPYGDPDADSRDNMQEYIEMSSPVLHTSVESDTVAPSAPVITAAAPVESGAEISLSLSADTQSVQFFYGTDPDALTLSSLKQEVQANPCHLLSLADSTLYYVSARAFDQAGNMSEASEIKTFTTPAGTGPNLPSAPTVSGEFISVSNPSAADFSGFKIYFGLSPDLSDAQSTFVFPDDGSVTQIGLSDYLRLLNADRMYVRIAAIDSNQHEGTPSQIFMIQKSQKGDLDHDGDIGLSDAIIALQVVAGVRPDDIYGEDSITQTQIGLADAVYAMQKSAGLRQ